MFVLEKPLPISEKLGRALAIILAASVLVLVTDVGSCLTVTNCDGSSPSWIGPASTVILAAIGLWVIVAAAVAGRRLFDWLRDRT